MERIELKSNIPESILRPVLKALMEGRICEIQYLQNNKVLNLSVVLLKFVSKDSIYYLNIYDTSDNKYKLIAIDKIKEINLTTNKLSQEELQKHFNFINSAWGIMTSGNITEVTFEINNDILVYFDKNPVHQSQRIEKSKNKNIVHLRIHNSKEFIRWALRFGKHLRIIEPKEVMEELIKFY